MIIKIVIVSLLILSSCSINEKERFPSSVNGKEKRLLVLLEKGIITSREFLARLVSKLRIDHDKLEHPYCNGKKMNLYEECIAEGEEELFESFLSRLYEIQLKNMKHKDHRGEKEKMVRGFHAKQHACLNAKFIISGKSNKPKELFQGVFKEPGKEYSAVVRFSNAKGINTKDFKPDLRGFAVKVYDVVGDRLDTELKERNTQDFVMFNKPTTIGSHPEEAMAFAEALAKGKLETAKFMIKNKKIAIELNKAFGVTRSLLTETYFSAAPYGLGIEGTSDYRAMKYQFSPCEGKGYIERGRGFRSMNYLQNNLEKNIKKQDLCFDMKIQIQTDARLTPLEDGAIEWREVDSPAITVATLIIPKGQFIKEGELDQKCDRMSFNPWNGIKEHRPLSATNRARRLIYQQSLINRMRSSSSEQFTKDK